MSKRNPPSPIDKLILELRGQRVILDSDLAAVYGVTNKRLLQQFARNRSKFPSDFEYVLTRQEVTGLRLQNEAAKSRGGRRTPPIAFTEHGAIMAATILNSEEAVAMSVFVVRAFVKFREVLAAGARMGEKLERVKRELTRRLDGHEELIQQILDELQAILPPAASPKKKIGFQLPASSTVR